MAYVKGTQLKNISGNTSDFDLAAGQYGVTVSATFGGGSVTLQKKSSDGSTYVTCLTAFSSAGYATVNLPRGVYRVAVATATAVYCDIEPVAGAE